MSYFSEDELKCQHCGAYEVDPEFLERLNSLRADYGKPMTVSSGYRCPEHPIEVKKPSGPGAHTSSRAADIAVQGEDALRLVELAIRHGFTGIGINQKGSSRFIHLDDISDDRFPRPTIWSY